MFLIFRFIFNYRKIQFNHRFNIINGMKCDKKKQYLKIHEYDHKKHIGKRKKWEYGGR